MLETSSGPPAARRVARASPSTPPRCGPSDVFWHCWPARSSSKGNLELGALACVLQHDSAAAATDHAGHPSGHEGVASAAVAGVDASTAPAPTRQPCEESARGSCGTGPMAPGHCATMHAGVSAATAPADALTLRTRTSHEVAAALPAGRPTSRDVAPDVPPPRA